MKNKWTKSKILQVAKKAKYRKVFRTKYGGAYYAAVRLGLIDQIYNNMPARRGPEPWTVEELEAIAKKYISRSHWQYSEPTTYHAAWRKGLLEKLCKHMMIPASHKKKVACSNGIIYPSIRQAARELQISGFDICKVLKGRYKHIKGYTFKYA